MTMSREERLQELKQSTGSGSIEQLEADLNRVPGLRVETVPQKVGDLVRSKHIVRRADNGEFVADIIINDALDPGATYLRHSTEQTLDGEALLRVLVGGPQMMRELLALIQKLSDRAVGFTPAASDRG